MAVGPGAAYSPSVQEALDWAAAVARVREQTPPSAGPPVVNPLDLFAGALLAHADVDGEVPVLLDHFGLTARDVVGEEYARITPTTLATVLPSISPGAQVPEGPGLSEIIGAARQYASGSPQLVHLLGGMLTASTALMTRLDEVFAGIGESRAGVAASYEEWIKGQPQNRGVAGRLLRDWLQEHNPRTPVSVAGFSTDDVAGLTASQPDLVGISPESNALAYLVASRDLAPPLAIGLFGDWGSGKSFLMRDVRTRVDRLVELSSEQPQHESAVWQNIQHIDFNAWEYVQGDLWAALLEKVFRTLDTRVKAASLVTERRKPVLLELERQKAALQAAQAEQKALETSRQKAQDQVDSAQAEVKRREALAKKESPTAAEARAMVTDALGEQWDEIRLSDLGESVDDLSQALQEAWTELRTGRALLGPYWRSWKHIAVVTAAVLVVPLVAWTLQALTTIPDVSAVLAALTAGIPALTGWLRSVTGWTARQRQRIEQAQAKVEAMRRKPVGEARAALRQAQARLATADAALADQSATVAGEQHRATVLADELRSLTPGRVFVEFAEERSTDYRSRLGLFGTVREDLRRLEREITANNAAALGRTQDPHDPSVPNRIVLYIDDLDRCPPAKVVQVLEAVHLLLAFPLFVVFVAVDSRWLSSALIEELHALRTVNHGPWTKRVDTPTARDYLEKIFQLPLWVQPLTGIERGRIVSGLLTPTVRSSADGSTAGTHGLSFGPEEAEAVDRLLGQSGTGLRLETNALSLSPTELEFIASLGPLLGDTPRRVKRFVNTVQFLLSIRPPLSADGERPPRRAVALYAALREGLPGVARQVFSPGSMHRPLTDVLTTTGVTDDERRLLLQWLDLPGHDTWKQVAPVEIGDRSEMVQRLGFDRPVI